MVLVHIHDLPVYRVDPLRSELDVYRMIDRAVAQGRVPAGGSAGDDDGMTIRDRVTDHLLEKYGPWHFNEITGYLRLYFQDSRVGGEYVGQRRRRLTLSRTKVFTSQTPALAPKRDLPDPSSNRAIHETVLAYVEDCGKALPRRYFDDLWLRTIGRHVDWIGVLDAARREAAERGAARDGA